MTAAEQLSALDATFLELEQADGSAHMHIGGVLVFAPAAGRAAPTRGQVLRRITSRLDVLPRLRQKLSDPSVTGLRRPHWVDDPGFDPAAHVVRAALPAPGGEAELLEWAGAFYSQRLDRRIPLWEVAVVEGLAGGRWALATKVHHAFVDGVGSLDTADLFADGVHVPPARKTATGDAHQQAAAVRLARAGLDALLHPRRTAGHAEALAELILREEVVGAPSCSLNVPIGEHRRLAAADTTLDELAAIRAVLGGTVNDLVLTAVTTGLRDLFLARGEEPPRGLRAMVPVNVRPGGDGSLGNRISSRFVVLPVDEPDLVHRHGRVMAAGHHAMSGHQAAGTATLLEVSEHLPPALHTQLAKTIYGTRLFNVTVTNVPGPPKPMRAFRSHLETVLPIVPIAAEHAVGVAVISYGGRLTFCVNADRDRAPDAGRVAAGITAAIAGLRAAAREEVPA